MYPRVYNEEYLMFSIFVNVIFIIYERHFPKGKGKFKCRLKVAHLHTLYAGIAMQHLARIYIQYAIYVAPPEPVIVSLIS